MKKKIVAVMSIVSCLLFSTATYANAYTVKSGDSLWKISNQNNTTVKDVMNLNSLSSYAIYPGQNLVLPNEMVKYTVQAKDTLVLISKKFNVPLDTLIKANTQLRDPNNISIGLTLNIPSKGINMIATAYSGDASENGGWANVDYYGNKLEIGTIAVDPNVIPLGTKVYVTGYSFGTLPVGGMIAYAKDIGSAIKGNHIDVYSPGTSASVSAFGIQNVKVYILN